MKEVRVLRLALVLHGRSPRPRHEGKHPELKDKVIVPDVLLQPHNVSLELTFYEGGQAPSFATDLEERLRIEDARRRSKPRSGTGRRSAWPLYEPYSPTPASRCRSIASGKGSKRSARATAK